MNDLSLCTRLHRTLQSNTHFILNLVQVKLLTRPALHTRDPGIPGRSALAPGAPPGPQEEERERRWRASGGSAPHRHGQSAALLLLLPSAHRQTCETWARSRTFKAGFFCLPDISGMNSS